MITKAMQPKAMLPEKNNKLGIEKTKTILTISVGFFLDVIEVIKSKNYFRLAEVLFRLMQFGNIVSIAQQAWAEAKEYSLEETKAIIAHVKQELELENKKTEETIERAIEVIPRVYELVLKGTSLFADVQDVYNEIRAIFSSKGELAVAA